MIIIRMNDSSVLFFIEKKISRGIVSRVLANSTRLTIKSTYRGDTRRILPREKKRYKKEIDRIQSFNSLRLIVSFSRYFFSVRINSLTASFQSSQCIYVYLRISLPTRRAAWGRRNKTRRNIMLGLRESEHIRRHRHKRRKYVRTSELHVCTRRVPLENRATVNGNDWVLWGIHFCKIFMHTDGGWVRG